MMTASIRCLLPSWDKYTLQILVPVILTTDLFLSFLIELQNAEICGIDKDTFKTIDKVICLYKDECV
jgi:hypothetical protein